MSPLPLSTSTESFQGGGRVAARLLRGGAVAAEVDHERERDRDDEGGRCAGGEPAPDGPARRRLDRHPGERARLAMVDPERGRVAEQREHRRLVAGKAVEPALLEPLDLLRPERGPLGGLLDVSLRCRRSVVSARGLLGGVGG